jgi:hypothetical protein
MLTELGLRIQVQEEKKGKSTWSFFCQINRIEY